MESREITTTISNTTAQQWQRFNHKNETPSAVSFAFSVIAMASSTLSTSQMYT
jgi:hypothetical protein